MIFKRKNKRKKSLPSFNICPIDPMHIVSIDGKIAFMDINEKIFILIGDALCPRLISESDLDNLDFTFSHEKELAYHMFDQLEKHFKSADNDLINSKF